MKEPEIGRLGISEVGEIAALMPSRQRERFAFGGHYFNLPAGEIQKIIAGENIQQRGNKLQIAEHRSRQAFE